MIPTARVGRAHSYRARSASKGDRPSYPLPPPPFFSILLYRILKDWFRPDRLSQDSAALEFVENPSSRRIEIRWA